MQEHLKKLLLVLSKLLLLIIMMILAPYYWSGKFICWACFTAIASYFKYILYQCNEFVTINNFWRARLTACTQWYICWAWFTSRAPHFKYILSKCNEYVPRNRFWRARITVWSLRPRTKQDIEKKSRRNRKMRLMKPMKMAMKVHNLKCHGSGLMINITRNKKVCLILPIQWYTH